MEPLPTIASFSDIFKIHDHRDQRGPLLLIQQFKFPGSVFLILTEYSRLNGTVA
jgi:hypothetical protein